MKRCRPLLGTYVEIAVHDDDDPRWLAAVDQAFDAMARVARLMSFHAPNSELSLINAAPAGAILELDAWTFDVLALARDLHEATRGRFDCGVGSHLVAWGLLPAHGARRAPGSRSTIADVSLLPDRRIRLHRPVCLDLGGIAKGYAVDRAIDALAGAGVSGACVNAGGDLRVLGDRPQPIHVRDAADPHRLHYLGELADGALATSSVCFSLRDTPEGARSALVDPATGTSVTLHRNYTVLAPSCAVADGLTKALALGSRLDDESLVRYGAQGWMR